MPTYVALLRGINVGGNKKIAMSDLRSLLARVGYTNIRTHLNSGNAVFAAADEDAGRVAGAIESAIQDSLGLSVRCIVRTAAEMRGVVDATPLEFVSTGGSRLAVHFLAEAPDPTLLAAHDPTALAPDQIRLGDRLIYQWCPDGFLAAPDVGAFVRMHWRAVVTARNWNTVAKLAELAGTGSRP